MKTPLYSAKVEPDIYFFGFDLTAEVAKGSDGSHPGDENKPGWFFVIKERPGEPRFGLDLGGPNAEKNTWSDVAWEDVAPGLPEGGFLQITNATQRHRSDSADRHVAGRVRRGAGATRRGQAGCLEQRGRCGRSRVRALSGAGAGGRARERNADDQVGATDATVRGRSAKTLTEARAAQASSRTQLFRTRERLAQRHTQAARARAQRVRTRRQAARPAASSRRRKRRLTATLEETRARATGARGRCSRPRVDRLRNEWTDPRRICLEAERRHSSDAVSAASGNALQDRRARWGGAVHAAVGAHLSRTSVSSTRSKPRSPKRSCKSATIFWREYFHAAGVESAERAAWRALVASHGSGRATWIVKQFRPRNPLRPGDPEGDAEPRDQAAVHRRGRGAARRVHARDAERRGARRARRVLGIDLESRQRRGPKQPRSRRSRMRVGAARADELSRACVPTTSTRHRRPDSRAPPRRRASSFVFLPKREDVDTRARSWSKAATASLLPERFVLLGYQGGERSAECS